MKTYSNIPLPDAPKRWKEGEFGIYINHKDNGYLPTDDPNTDISSRRYEAEFTIIKELSAESAIHAFTRMITDPVLDRGVVDNIEINGKPAIETKPTYTNKVSTTIFPVLPATGQLKKGQVYSYNNGAVMVVQDHARTIYAPELTPALFSFYRDNASVELEWMEGENVEKGWKRTFGGKTYECLQSHQTLSTWTPDKTPALWKEVIVVVDIPVWVQPTGAHDAYRLGAKVHFPTITDPIYESLIDANVWSPTVYPAGWKKL